MSFTRVPCEPIRPGMTSILLDLAGIPTNPGGRALLSSDDFQRANGAIGSTSGPGTLDPQAWTAQLGTWVTNANQAQCSALGAALPGGVAGIVTVELGTPDADLSYEHAVNDVNGQGLVFRYADNANFMMIRGDNTQLQIFSVVAGAVTLIKDLGAALGAGTVVRALFYGDTIEAWVDGRFMNAVTSSANNTATKGGFSAQGTGQRFDRWTAR